MADNQHKNDRTVDGPTVYGPNTGQYIAPPTAHQPDEPTVADPGREGGVHEPTVPAPPAHEPPTVERAGEEPTIARPTGDDEATAPTTDQPTTHQPTAVDPTRDEPTVVYPTAAQPTTTAPSGHQLAANPHDDEPTSTVGSDDPTIHQPTDTRTSHQLAGNQDEPTITVGANDPSINQPTAAAPSPSDYQREPINTVGTNDPTTSQPTSAGPPPTGNQDEPTITVGANNPTTSQPTIAAVSQPAEPVEDDEATVAVGTDEPTTTGPTVGGWPFDQFEPPPPEELIWQAEPPPPEPLAATRSPAYYVSLGAAVVLVVGLVALAVVVTVMRPQQEIAGAASAGGIPQITPSTAAPPTTAAPTSPPSGPLAELATHPLSSLPTRMADATCALPRFDPADDRQAAFYAAAKVCADDAWRAMLEAAGLDGTVTVVTLTGPAQTPSCGELAPTSPATECDGTVYLTPAYLRDTEQNGRFPGRYLGVFLREYARALQFTTGIDELVAAVKTGSAEDLDKRLAQQATCLAGVMSGAMAGRGAIDSNITGEIRDRLSTKDAPPEAKAWLDKGFQQRTPAACNAWVN